MDYKVEGVRRRAWAKKNRRQTANRDGGKDNWTKEDATDRSKQRQL